MIFLKRLCIILGVVWGVGGAANEAPVSPDTDPEVKALQQRLLDDQAGLSLAEKQLKQLKSDHEALLSQLDVKHIDAAMVSRAELAVSTAKLAYENARIELATARQTEVTLDHSIHELDQQLKNQLVSRAAPSDQVVRLNAQLQIKRAALALIKSRTALLRDTMATDEEILVTQENWHQKIKHLHEIQMATFREAKQQELEARLKQDESMWQKKASMLKQQLAFDTLKTEESERLKDQIFEAEEKAALVNTNLNLARQQARVNSWHANLGGAEGNPQALRNLMETGKRIKEELSKLEKLILDKVDVLAGWRNLYQKRKDAKPISGAELKQKIDLLDELLAGYQAQQKIISDLLSQVKKSTEESKIAYSQGLSIRQSLPGTLNDWVDLMQAFWQLPKMVWQSGLLLGNRVGELFAEFKEWFLFSLFLMFASLVFAIWGERKMQKFTTQYIHRARRSSRFITHAIWFISVLIHRNLIPYVLGVSFFLWVWFWEISAAAYGLFGSILLILLLFKTLMDANRLLLLERFTDEPGQDVRLYRGLKWALWLGGLLTILLVLSRQLNMSMEKTAFIDRLFMLFLFAVSYPLIKNRHFLEQLVPSFEKRPKYVQHALRWLGILFPAAILSNALTGLVGYVNLAWRMGLAEAQFLLMLTLWMLLRGLLGDLMAACYEYFIRYVQNGWLWTESVLKPLERLLNILLFALGVLALGALYGWGKDSAVFDVFNGLLFHPLFHIYSTPMTVFSLLEMGFATSVLIWASRWSREFAYRWLFSGVKDLGIRNSFSVFAQYTIAAAGFYVVLIVAGIDVTTLAFASGALLVGIGFGLQNLANNIMSGLLLLLERPVQTGDYVSIGGNEGEVVRIGIRSMTVRSWDHYEVIIPNAEAVGNSFMNWTHHDTIIRATFPLRVDLNDDPHQIRHLVESSMQKNPYVLQDPRPEALLTEFGDSHLLFQIRFFIDLKVVNSRPRAQSAVMFDIWDTLKAAGIRLPYPHRELAWDAMTAGPQLEKVVPMPNAGL